MSLPTRKIGKDDVPYPGLGCMGMSAFYSTLGDTEKNLKVLKTAYDEGCRFWDTADVYGNNSMGDNEILLAQAIKQFKMPRKELFIATKFGNNIAADGSRVVSGKPEYVKEAMAKSLERLETDYVDLYYQHRVDPKTPIEETVKAMDELRQAGKARYLGLSECSTATLRRACKVAKIDALQVEYSIWTTDIESNGLLEACKELDIAIIAYSPLGRGFISGRWKTRSDLPPGDGRLNFPRYSEENFPKNIQLVQALENFASKKTTQNEGQKITTSQLALAWAHSQWEKMFTIPGTTDVGRLKENLGSADVKLSEDELKEIRTILNGFALSGERYPPAQLSRVNL